MTSTEPSAAARPLVLGDAAAFAAARRLLRDAGYDERAIVRRGTLPEGRPPADACDALAHLFLDERALAAADATRLLGDGLAPLRALGLVTADEHGDAVRATALLYPLGELHLVSDLSRPGGESPPEDVVYPALTDSTAHFLRTLPDDGCGRLLELCAGTGVAALRLAPACGEAWATDVSARAAHFAEFNRRLNARDNVTVACGDVWDAVGGRTFDRVVAHPPYVAGADDAVFRDGGEDGEAVTRRIVEGLPAHLAPGGALHCTCAVTDRAGAPFERRVRQWLGEAADRFDVFFFPTVAHDAVAHFARRAADGLDAMDAFARRARTFRRLGIERIAYGSFVLGRLPDHERRAPLTVRRRAPGARWEDLRRAMDVERALAEPGVADALLALPLVTSPDVELATTRRVGDAGPTACHVRLGGPLAVDASVRPWVGDLLLRARGARPLADEVRTLRADGVAPAEDDDPTELPALVRALVAAGVLRLVHADAPAAAALAPFVRQALARA